MELTDGAVSAANMARKRVRELEAQVTVLRETLQGIADADWRKWEELASPDEFVRWAKSRASHALTQTVPKREAKK